MATTVLRWSWLNVWNGNMLVLHEQTVRLYCCVLRWEDVIFFRCSMFTLICCQNTRWWLTSCCFCWLNWWLLWMKQFRVRAESTFVLLLCVWIWRHYEIVIWSWCVVYIHYSTAMAMHWSWFDVWNGVVLTLYKKLVSVYQLLMCA